MQYYADDYSNRRRDERRFVELQTFCAKTFCYQERKVPMGHFHYQDLSFPGTFIPENFRSRELQKFQGTKVPHRDLSFLGTKGLGHKFPKVGKSLGTNLLIMRIDNNRRWEEGILAGLV